MSKTTESKKNNEYGFTNEEWDSIPKLTCQDCESELEEKYGKLVCKTDPNHQEIYVSRL